MSNENETGDDTIVLSRPDEVVTLIKEVLKDESPPYARNNSERNDRIYARYELNTQLVSALMRQNFAMGQLIKHEPLNKLQKKEN